ncbi:MAG: hypothetical protein HQK64_02140 [Desulfamplus sp.]|nr:hypothetical protein [Desulfamplus sp.]MBF0390012.1 hypothetical protein [Desulfamplus sp.]
MANKSWSDLVKDHKILLIIVVVGFFLIEIEIFAVAVMKSGRQSWMNVIDDSGEVIYQVKGSTLTNFNKYYFENTFGSIDDYQVKLVTEDVPFPFRGWFAAAIGIPVGLILLLAFILKSVMVMLYGKKSNQDYSEAQKEVYVEGEQSGEEEIKQVQFGTAEAVGSLMDQVSRLNVFIIGFFIISGVMLYLVIPDMLTFLAKAGIETLLNFKWFFIALFVGLFLLFAWFMYMKYQLARKSMDAQTEIRKYEIKMEYAKFNTQAALEYKRATGKDAPEALMIGYSDLEYKDVEYQEDGKDKGDAQTNQKGNQEK